MNNNIFLTIMIIISMLWTGVSLIGYILYKNRDDIKSWEDGVKRILTAGFNWLYEEATGEDDKKNLFNASLILTNTEILQLVKAFDKHPYETPTLANNNFISHGVAWYDIHALGLSTTYTGLSNDQIKQMAEFVIQNYFMSTRETQILVYIQIASPVRLYFAIPLSENGRFFLEKHNQPTAANICSSVGFGTSKGLSPSIDSDSLEEEIDILEN